MIQQPHYGLRVRLHMGTLVTRKFSPYDPTAAPRRLPGSVEETHGRPIALQWGGFLVNEVPLQGCQKASVRRYSRPLYLSGGQSPLTLLRRAQERRAIYEAADFSWFEYVPLLE